MGVAAFRSHDISGCFCSSKARLTRFDEDLKAKTADVLLQKAFANSWFNLPLFFLFYLASHVGSVCVSSQVYFAYLVTNPFIQPFSLPEH